MWQGTNFSGVCNCSMFCCTLLYAHSSIAIILMGKRELIALLNLSSWCLVMVERLFLAVPRGSLQFVIVVFPDHTHLLFLNSLGHQSAIFFAHAQLENSENKAHQETMLMNRLLDKWETISGFTVVPIKRDSDVILCLQFLRKNNSYTLL